MKSFTILEGRGKSHVGKTVTILEVTKEKVFVKMGRTNYEILLNGNTLDNLLYECTDEYVEDNENVEYRRYFNLYKLNLNTNGGGIGVYNLKINE